MKLSKSSSIRVLIRKQGSKAANITVEDTTVEEAANYIKNVLRDRVDPFAEGRVTSITLYKTKGDTEDKEGSLTFSFRGMDPSEVKLLICESLASTETTS